MNNQYLIIYQFTSLYEILKELEFDLNFKIIQALNDKSLNDAIKSQKKKIFNYYKKKNFQVLIINMYQMIYQLSLQN